MSIDDVRVSGIEIILVVARKTVSISIDVVRVSGIGRSVVIVRGTHKSPDPAIISVSEGVVRGSTVQESAFVSEDSGIGILLDVARKTVSISIDVVRVSGIGRSVFIVRGTHKSPDPAKISVSEGVVRGSTVQGSAFVSEDEVRVSTVRGSTGAGGGNVDESDSGQNKILLLRIVSLWDNMPSFFFFILHHRLSSSQTTEAVELIITQQRCRHTE